MSCDGLPDAYLEARLAGALESDLRWQDAALTCDGMRRPDGLGLRVTFKGQVAGSTLTLVFAAPRLAEGESAHAVPVNVTLIVADGAIYGTRGEGKCLLDEVRQTPLPAAGNGDRRWRVDARGFCLEPARAVNSTSGAILLSRFDFRGLLSWEPDPPPPPAPAKAP